MKSYRELMFDRIYNGLSGREEIEWTNFWFDESNLDTKHRILLVGDSTARMIRSTMAKELSIPVDFLGTSSAIDDELFINQVDAFFNNSIYQYEAILVQLGHHSRIGKDGFPYTDSDYIKFYEDLELFIKYLAQHCKKIVLVSVLMSVVPCKNKLLYLANRLHLISEKPNLTANAIKQKKNLIIKNVASKLGISYYDMCGYMDGQSYKHIDHIHYENRAKKCIARFLINSMNKDGIVF